MKHEKVSSVDFWTTWTIGSWKILEDLGRFQISTEFRLWHRQRGQAPGLAMSRCLGDALGFVAAHSAMWSHRSTPHQHNTLMIVRSFSMINFWIYGLRMFKIFYGFILYYHRIIIVLSSYYYCIIIVLLSYYYRIIIVVLLYYYISVSLLLYHYCIIIVLLLYHYCLTEPH